MLKYIILILIFNVIYAQDFDIYDNKNHNPVKEFIKRELEPEERPENAGNVVKTLRENIDSVKKDLTAVTVKKTLTAVTVKNDSISSNSSNLNVTQSLNSTGNGEINNSTGDEKKFIKNVKHVEHPGAALRGFYVFLGLSVLIVIYFVFKAFRLRPGAPPPTTVRKYGIVGRRSDMEMLPLPLAEEEDDDTLFDMGTQINR